MKPVPVLLVTLFLSFILSDCSKNEEKGRHILQKGLRGKILYSSCATAAVQVLNKDLGENWTNCADRKVYGNVIDANIVNRNGIAPQEEFNFNIVEDEPAFRCDMIDCKPSMLVTIVITGN